MKEDGLHNLTEDWNSDYDHYNTDQNKRYRYQDGSGIDSIKEIHQDEIENLKGKIDSTREAQQKELEHLQDSLQNERKKIDLKLKSLEKTTAIVLPCYPVRKSKSSYPFLSYI